MFEQFFKGHGKLKTFYGEFNIKLELTIFPNNHKLIGFIDKHIYEDLFFSRDFDEDKFMKDISLKEIELFSDNQKNSKRDYILNSKEVKDLFIKEVKGINDETRLTFVSKCQSITLESNLHSDIDRIFYDDYTLSRHDGFQIDDTCIRLVTGQKYISVLNSNSIINKKFIKSFELAMMLIQGKPIKRFLTQRKNNEFKIRISQSQNYNIHHSITNNYDSIENILRKSVTFFGDLKEKEFEKWERAIFFLIAGRKVQSIDVLLINFFVFIEVLGNGKEMLEYIIDVLKVEKEDALLIKKARNALIHKNDNINAFLNAAKKNKKLKFFDEDDLKNKQNFLIATYRIINKQINIYISKKINVPKEIMRDYSEYTQLKFIEIDD